MVVRTSFLIRLIAGLAIAAPMAFYLATAPLTEAESRWSGFPDLTALSVARSSLLPVGLEYQVANEPDDSMVLARAFASQTSELLWSDALSLSDHSEDTAENVRLAAEAIDLAVLRPSEIFSFNSIVGIRTENKGYRPGLMYSNGEVVTGVGGGICMVSTVLYNAALETGLRIIERHPHSGPVSYAAPGRDAAVSFGWADLCFKNNSGALLFIRSEVEEDKLVVAVYGKEKPGRTVEIASEDYEELPYSVFEQEDDTVPEGEVVVEQNARPGFAVTTARLIKQDGKLISREVISRDIVLPRHKIVRIPPGSDEFAEESPQMRAPAGASAWEWELLMPARASSRVIRIPRAHEPKRQVGLEPLPLPGASERNLPTSDRTASTASE